MTSQALTVMAEWGIEVSVNVSPVQLEDAVFTTDMVDAAVSADVAPLFGEGAA